MQPSSRCAAGRNLDEALAAVARRGTHDHKRTCACACTQDTLPPQEQDEMMTMLVEQLQSSSPDERKSFVEVLDGGYFPSRVSEGVKARLATIK